MKRVLVTGGAGYIGSHACKILARAGFEPVAYDNLSRGHKWAVRWGPLEIGDIRDGDRLAGILTKYRPDAVMHFAALAYVGESVERPDTYYDNNVGGTLSLLKAMLTHGVNKLVFSSTCATYGIAETTPITEMHPQRPVNPYGWSKLMVERMLRDNADAFGLRAIALRYFNAAGADPEGEIGEDHDPETHLIPLLLQTALGQRSQVTIFGNDYETPDGTCVRDYIHVTDLADAHVLAYTALDNSPGFNAYNLGNAAGFSVRQVIDTAETVCGRHIEVAVGPRRAGDPATLVGDATRIRHDLDWSPQHPTLSDILQTAWLWHRSQAREY